MVNMSDQLVRHTIYGSDDFTRVLAAFAEGHGIIPTLRVPEPEAYPIERMVVERASIASIAFAEDDAEVRFFRVSPSDIRALHDGNAEVEVIYPVVQVLLDTTELVHLVHSLATILPRPGP